MAAINVSVSRKKVIKPSNPTLSDFENLKLSIFDQLAPHMYTHVLYYYLVTEHDSNMSNTTTTESSKKCSQLEKSLSSTLNMFYPLAGRYSAKHVRIECRDQGVEWFETRVNGNLKDFLEDPKTEVLDQFLPWKSPPASNLDTSPILGIQINNFGCGGIVLGMSFSHTIADAYTITRFMTEWGIHNRTRGIHPVLCENRNYNQFTSLFPCLSTEILTDTDLITADYEFIGKRLFFQEKIISDVREEVAPFLNFRPTRVVVIMALIWKAFMVVSRDKHSYLRNSMLCLSMNLRGKQSFWQPELNYGNFWMLVPVFFNPSDSEDDNLELQNLIYLIGNTIRQAKDKLENVSPKEISAMFIRYRRKIFKSLQESKDWDNYFVSSWCNFPLSKADFGWGNPTWVSSATTQNYAVTWLLDAINGDGIEAWVNLKKEDMTQFEKIVVSTTTHV